MFSHFFKQFSKTAAETSDLEKGFLSTNNIQAQHNELSSHNLQKLMTDESFKLLDDRTKLSIRDGILLDLNSFHETNAIDLAQALQVILLLDKNLHGLLNFSEEKALHNPFKVQRSTVDDFFTAVAVGAIPRPTPIGFLSTHYLLHHTHMDADSSKFCLICTCAVGVTCCTCWATAKSVEAVLNSPEANIFKGFKITASTLIGIGTTIATQYYFGDSFGEFLQGDEPNQYADFEYGLGSWGIPILLGLTSLWSTNLISAKLPCLPKTEIPIEARSDQLIAYGENQKQKLQTKLGEEDANKLLNDLTKTIVPYFLKFPASQTTDKKLQDKMIWFTREIILVWISERTPEALAMLENKKLNPNRTYGTNTQSVFQQPITFESNETYIPKKNIF